MPARHRSRSGEAGG